MNDKGKITLPEKKVISNIIWWHISTLLARMLKQTFGQNVFHMISSAQNLKLKKG